MIPAETVSHQAKLPKGGNLVFGYNHSAKRANNAHQGAGYVFIVAGKNLFIRHT